jgi:flagellar biosynthesis/type III secretory pathway ATPase
MDSLSRVAMAQRELGLAVGEPPATRGYPPSAFAIIPRLLERAGPGVGKGSITAFYTTLLEGDDLGDPVADCVRATSDGHVALNRNLADRGHYPAIDVLGSVSRVMPEISEPEHLEAAMGLRRLIADYREVEELVTLGAYQHGSTPRYDRALAAYPDIETFLMQSVGEATEREESIAKLMEISSKHGGMP